MNEQQVIELLRERVAEHGSQKNFAQHHRIAESYLSDVLNGRRSPGEAILNTVGLERVVTYRVIIGGSND